MRRGWRQITKDREHSQWVWTSAVFLVALLMLVLVILERSSS